MKQSPTWGVRALLDPGLVQRRPRGIVLPIRDRWIMHKAARATPLGLRSQDEIGERKMPHINVQLVEGRTDEQARTLIRALSEATVKVLGVPEGAVLITLTEVAPAHWGVGGRTMAEIRDTAGHGVRP